MSKARKLFAPKGTIIEDENGVPAFEFVEDVYSFEPVYAASIVALPSREHPEPNSEISPIIHEWHRKKTGRYL